MKYQVTRKCLKDELPHVDSTGKWKSYLVWWALQSGIRKRQTNRPLQPTNPTHITNKIQCLTIIGLYLHITLVILPYILFQVGSWPIPIYNSCHITFCLK